MKFYGVFCRDVSIKSQALKDSSNKRLIKDENSMRMDPASNCMCKVNNGNTRTM